MDNLEFGERYSTEVSISEQKDKVMLYLSDALKVAEDLPNLPQDFQNKIILIIENSKSWFDKSVNRIKGELKEENEVQLISIYILSEPDDSPLLFGLEFWISLDEEHGRGMKVDADTMEIIDYGLADVAFC